MISIDDFKKIELKVGTILGVDEVDGSDKLYKIQLDLGEENPRQILSGIKAWYTKEDLLGKQIIVVANLEPREMMGEISNGMLLASEGDERPILLTPLTQAPNGAKIK